MHNNNNFLFYLKAAWIVISALYTQHSKCSLWNSHEGLMLYIQPAFRPQPPCIQVCANLTGVFSSFLGTHVVLRGHFLTVPKETSESGLESTRGSRHCRHSQWLQLSLPLSLPRIQNRDGGKAVHDLCWLHPIAWIITVINIAHTELHSNFNFMLLQRILFKVML